VGRTGNPKSIGDFGRQSRVIPQQNTIHQRGNTIHFLFSFRPAYILNARDVTNKLPRVLLCWKE
jgi:hypothetical protein